MCFYFFVFYNLHVKKKDKYLKFANLCFLCFLFHIKIIEKINQIKSKFNTKSFSSPINLPISVIQNFAFFFLIFLFVVLLIFTVFLLLTPNHPQPMNPHTKTPAKNQPAESLSDDFLFPMSSSRLSYASSPESDLEMSPGPPTSLSLGNLPQLVKSSSDPSIATNQDNLERDREILGEGLPPPYTVNIYFIACSLDKIVLQSLRVNLKNL